MLIRMLEVAVVLQPLDAADDPPTEWAPVLGHGLAVLVVVVLEVVPYPGNAAKLLLTTLHGDRSSSSSRTCLRY